MIVKEFSKFLINLKYDNIPNKIIYKSKLCFLDYLAVYKRGMSEESSKIAINTIQELFPLNYSNSNDENHSINSSNNYLDNTFNRSYVLNDGFIRGIASHALDLDDGHRVAHLHIGSIVFSTAIAMISDSNINLNISGKEFFEAIVGAYEIVIVLGMIANPNHRNQGFHSTGTLGAFASAAVASKLLKLDLNKTINCFGLCGTQSAGLLESDHAGSMAKSLHSGKAVYNGILSSFLAKNGFSGAESIIDGNEGLLKAMCLKSNFNYYKLDNFLKLNLGKYHISEVYLKKYPFCRHIHSTIDSSLYLADYLETLNKDINAIDEINISTYKIATEHNNFNPKNKEDLKQSLPYAVAISLVCKDLNLDLIDDLVENGLLLYSENHISLNEKDILIKNIKNIVDKITISKNSNFESLTPLKRPSKVTIKLNEYFDNESFEDVTFYPLGESENPLSFKDILNKFHSLNPNYNLNNLRVIDEMEYNDMGDVLNSINIDS